MVSFYFFSTFKLQQIIYMPRPPLRPQAARVCWRGRERGGVTHPPKNIHPKFFFAKNSLEGATAATGRQGVLKGEGGGVTPQIKNFTKKFHNFFLHIFFSQKFPRRDHCGRTPPGGAKMGKKRGGLPHLQKNTGHKAQHNNLVYRPT